MRKRPDSAATVCYYPPFAPHEFVTSTIAAYGNLPGKSVYFYVICRETFRPSRARNFRGASLENCRRASPTRGEERIAKGFAAEKLFPPSGRNPREPTRGTIGGRNARDERSLVRGLNSHARGNLRFALKLPVIFLCNLHAARFFINRMVTKRIIPDPFRELHCGNFIEGFA